MILHAENREPDDGEHGHSHGHNHGDDNHYHYDHHPGHAHMPGTVDPSILMTKRGIRAVKWSYAGLFIAAFIPAIIFNYSISISLLASTIFIGNGLPPYLAA